MTVAGFILKHGISALDGKAVVFNGKYYAITLTEHDKELLSESGERFISSGNYRLAARDSNNMSVWVYKTDELALELDYNI